MARHQQWRPLLAADAVVAERERPRAAEFLLLPHPSIDLRPETRLDRPSILMQMNRCKISQIVCGVLSTVIFLAISIALFYFLLGNQSAKPNTPCRDSFGNVTYLHRGNLNFAQENTFDSAVNGSAGLGFNPEIDIQSSKEGVAVLFHDNSLKRMAGIEKDLVDTPAEELLNVTLSAEIDGYTYGQTNSIPELLPVVKAICEETPGVGINFDVKTKGGVIDAIVSSIKEANCDTQNKDLLLTTGHPDVAKEAREKFNDARLNSIRVGLYMPKPGEGHYFGLGQKFMLQTRLIHSLLSGGGASIIEFHKTTYDKEKEKIQEWADDGWCVGIYGIKPDEVDNYPGLNVYIVDKGPDFPDLQPYGGYGQDEPPTEVVYENGVDDSLTWYYGLIAAASVLLVNALLSFYLTVRACRSSRSNGNGSNDGKSPVQNNSDPESGAVV